MHSMTVGKGEGLTEEEEAGRTGCCDEDDEGHASKTQIRRHIVYTLCFLSKG